MPDNLKAVDSKAVSAKPTAGPWRVVGESSDHECGYGVSSVSIRNNGVFRICNTDMDALEMPEQLANARLIAAAPELLEALERAVHRLDRIEGFGCPQDILDEMHAAIAKARGGSR